MTGPERLWMELAKQSLRHAHRTTVNTLMAAGIDEDDAELAAYTALRDLGEDLLRELNGGQNGV